MSKFTRKALSISLSVVTAVSMIGPVAANAQSASDLQAQIAALLAQIQMLQSQLGSSQSPAPAVSSFTRDLTVGSKGDDVSALQGILISGGYLKISAPTGYFGPATKAALAAWQKATGLSPAVGYFGPKSRAALASAGAGSGSGPVVPGVVVPSGTDLYVSAASDTPAASTLGSGTSFNPVLKFKLTAGSKDVKVTSLKINKSGFVTNANIAGVDVIDSAGTRHGNVVSSISAENDVLILLQSEPIVIGAGKTETVTVRVNLGTGATSGTLSFNVQSAAKIGADTTSVGGVFPVMGSTFQLASGANIAAVTVAIQNVSGPGGTTYNVDSSNWQEITKFRVSETSGLEAVKIKKLAFYNYGNAGAGDYADVQLVDQTGNVLATAQPVSQNVIFDLSATPYMIDKGLYKDLTLRAKFLNGATRSVQLVIYNNYDIVVMGVDSAVTVLATATGNDTSFPVGDNVSGNTAYNKVAIGSGSMTFSKATDAPTASVVPGASNVVIAKYTAKPTGENMELRQVSFGISTSTGNTALTGTVYLLINDQIVYSAAASTFNGSGAANTITLSSYPILPAGQNSTITVQVSVSSNAGSTDAYTVKQMDLLQVKRMITNDLTDPLVAAIDNNQIAVKASALTITVLSQPVAGSVVAGTSQYEFGRFQLDSQAGGEDVKVTKLIVTDTLTGGNTAYTGVTNLQMYVNGQPLATTNSTVTNANTVSFTFTNALVVPRNTPVTISLKGDVVTVVSSTEHTYKVAALATDVTAIGATTGNTLAVGQMTLAGSSGQKQTVTAAGTLAISPLTGSGAGPQADQLVQVGSQDLMVYAFKLTSAYEAIKMQTLKLTWAGTSLNTNDVQNIRLYKGTDSTPFASAAQGTCAANSCTFTWTWSDNWGAGLVDPAVPVTVYVKANIGGQANAKLGNDFAFSIASTTTDIVAKGASSNSNPSSVSLASVTVGRSYITPFSVTIAADSPTTGSVSTQAVAAGTTVGRFKVMNNGSSKVTLKNVRFTDNGTNSTTTETYAIYASTDNQSDFQSTSSVASTSINLTNVTFGGANLTIGQSSYRYLSVVLATAGGILSGDSWNLSVASLGHLTYSVDDADLGWDGNVDGLNTSGVTTGLFVDGKPILGTINKQ